MNEGLTNYVIHNEDGTSVYLGDTFMIKMNRYSDPNRLNLARNAAIYLGKSDRDNIRRPLGIIKKGHVAAIFRGETVEFEFINVSKEVYDHLITYTTATMRAAGGNRALVSDDFTLPSDKVRNPIIVKAKIEQSMNGYKELLDSGETPQVARAAMPTSAKLNNFVFQFNFLTLGESVFKQRIWEKGAQGNTVKVVKAMYELCCSIDKELWDTFYEHKGTPAIEWQQARTKLNKKKMTVGEFELLLKGVNTQDSEMSIVEFINKQFGEVKSMW